MAETEQVLHAFHSTMHKLRVAQARVRVQETEAAGRVLAISYKGTPNPSRSDEELGGVMGAAAYTMVAVQPPVTGGCVIVVHDGRGRLIRQCAVAAMDVALYVAGRVDARGFAESWAMR